MSINIENNIKELKENGYTIINNVYDQNEINEYKHEFFNWYNYSLKSAIRLIFLKSDKINLIIWLIES